jgi:cobyric acid synthase
MVCHLDAGGDRRRRLNLLDTVLDCVSKLCLKYEVVLELEGAMNSDGRVFGTSPHGLFQSDRCRRAVLAEVGRQRGRAFVPGRSCFAEVGQLIRSAA